MAKKVAVLGATGIVGQRFVSLLSEHPWFELGVLAASERSTGRKYSEIVRWTLEKPLPDEVGEMIVEQIDPALLDKEGIDIAFSALPPEAAAKVEEELARRGIAVISNASNMRLEPDVPLLIPEVNPEHADVIELQRSRRGWSGSISKVPNCTSIILTLTLKPLHDFFGLSRVVASTMQALSGAGLTGVPSLAILDNLIPFIEGEEDKVEAEPRKMLGALASDGIRPSEEFSISASCHRVMVLEGHTIAAFVELRSRAEPEEVIKAFERFNEENPAKALGLPSSPPRPIVVRREQDRPQPRFDRNEGNGMSVVVGRVRKDRALGGIKYVVLGHNTIRGAAGNGVLIAELLTKKGYA
ncbi:MAG: aspartate-semialdehyde dehydrogenase [Desulfurococcaceae archaeon]